jgi:hyaluronoglucosaminidase
VITPDGRTAYVDSFRGTVVPIRTATNTAGKASRAGEGGALAVTPDGKTVYVASYGPGTITPIRTATGKAGKPVKVGRNPAAIAITR